MAFKMLSVAALAAQLLAIPSWTQFGGPANLPPVGFKGQQFVDSRGCLFLRAGFGGNVNWATRADGNHKPICGMAPTGSAAARKAVAEDIAPQPMQMPPATVAAQTSQGAVCIDPLQVANSGGATMQR